MPPRVRLAIFLVASFAIVAAAAIAYASGDDERAPKAVAGSLRPPGIPPADFDLVDENGKRATLADLKGRPGA